MYDLDRFLKAQSRDYEAAPEIDVFQRVLDKYFSGEKDQNTLAMIGK